MHNDLRSVLVLTGILIKEKVKKQVRTMGLPVPELDVSAVVTAAARRYQRCDKEKKGGVSLAGSFDQSSRH